jgi:hypothetical protein
MARYRKIDPRIHNDAKFKALSERGKLLFLTILTHPHMTALGAMRATEAGLCQEMVIGSSLKDADCPSGCPPGCRTDSPAGVFESYRNAFCDIIEKGLIKFDPQNACLLIPNFLRYNPPESPSVVMAWNQAGDLIPECQLRDELIENTREFLKGHGKPSFLEAFKLAPNGWQADPQADPQADGQADPQADGQGARQQEQEQEQDKNPPTPQRGIVSDEKTKKRGKRKADRVLPAYSSDFEKFWSAFPRRLGGRGGKEAAWRVWQRRVKNGSLPAIPDLMAALTKLVASEAWLKEDGRFIPMVSTFLNKGRWTDADDLESQAPPQNQPDPDCPHCHGRGLVEVERGGVKGQTACKCRSESHGS